MEYVTREEWGARKANRGGNALLDNVLGTGIHWHGGAVASRVRHHHQCAGVVRAIQNDHMDNPHKRWADIAYTDLVCPHGYIFEGRGKGKGTAAFGTDFHNARYYATCAIWGKGDGPANRGMLDAIKDAVALHRTWGARKDVIGHRDTFATECPGDDLYRHVQNGRFDTAGAPDVTDPTAPPKKKPTHYTPKGLTVRVIDMRNASNSRLVKGAGVAPMQRLLNVMADGLGGNNTRHALGVAQRRAGVTVDYMFGPDTASALLAGK